MRHRGVTPAAWVNALSGGWDGRLIVAVVLLAARRPAGGVLRRGRDLRRGVRGRGRSSAGWCSAASSGRSCTRTRRTEALIGMVLAAGAGTRLGPETAELPKTLLAVDGDRTILDVALANFAAVGLERAVVVTGYAAERIDERIPALQERHGLAVETVFNPKALEWNNAYSLWCARDHFAEGVLLANGDTVHPASVERVAAGRPRPRAGDRGRRRQDARRGGDEGPRHRRRTPRPHQQGARAGDRARRVHRRDADRAVRGRRRSRMR